MYGESQTSSQETFLRKRKTTLSINLCDALDVWFCPDSGGMPS